MNPSDNVAGRKWARLLILLAVALVAAAWFVLWLASFGHVGESACGNLLRPNSVPGCSRSRSWTSGYGAAFLLVAVLLLALAKATRSRSTRSRWPVGAMLSGDAFALLAVAWLRARRLDEGTGLDLGTSTPSSLSVVALSEVALLAMVVTTIAVAVAVARPWEDASSGEVANVVLGH